MQVNKWSFSILSVLTSELSYHYETVAPSGVRKKAASNILNLLEGLDDDGEQDVDEDEGARHGEDEEHESRGRRLRLAGNFFSCY